MKIIYRKKREKVEEFYLWPICIKRMFYSMSIYIYCERARAQVHVYPFSHAPSLRKDKAALVPVTADFGCGSWKKGGTSEKCVRTEYTKGIYEIKSCDECLVYSYHSKWTVLGTGVNRVHRAWSVEKNHPPFSNYFNYKDEPIWRVYSVSGVPWEI